MPESVTEAIARIAARIAALTIRTERLEAEHAR